MSHGQKTEITHGGFTLIETIMSLFITSLGVLAASSLVHLSLNSDKSVRTTLARFELSANLRRALTNRNSLKVTLLKNPVLLAAVRGSPGDFAAIGGSLATDNRAYGIDIYANDERILAGKGTAPSASGNTSTPVYYTLDGFSCSQPGIGSCLIACTAIARIQGSPEWGTPGNMVPRSNYPAWNPTLKPDFLMVTYTIEFISTSPTSTPIKKPLSGTVFISIDDIESLVP